MRLILAVRLIIASFLAALVTVSASAQTALPSAFVLTKPDSYDSVSLSPDGKHVAAIFSEMTRYCLDENARVFDPEKGECQGKPYKIKSSKTIYIYSLSNFKIVKEFRMPLRGTPVRLEWANNTHLFATGYWPPTLVQNVVLLGGMRVFSVPLDNEKAAFLFSDQTDVAKQNWNLSKITNPLRSDPEHIVMPANSNGDLDLWKVNVVTGKAVNVAKGKDNTFFWFTDDQGRPVMRFDCSSRSCRKINVYAPSGDSGNWKKIKSFKTRPDEKTQEYDFWPIAQSNDPNQFYVMSYEDADQTQSVKLFDLKTEEFIETIFEHPEYDVTGAFIDPLSGAYEGAIYIEDRINYAFKSPELQAKYEKIRSFFKSNENVALLGFNANDVKAVVYVTSPKNPGSYHIFDSQTGRMDELFKRNPDLESAFPTQTRILKIPAQDGTILTAYHTQPETSTETAGQAAPLLVMPHGGPEARDSYDYDTWVQYFALRGYQVLQVNFRGSSGYGRKFSEAGYGEWGGAMQTDVTDAAQYFYDQGLAMPENSCIFGYSYGGYAALYAGAATPDLFACTVAGGGISDLPRFLKQIRKDHGSDTELYDYWKTSIGDPKTVKDKLKATSPVELAASFKKPVLLLHGDNDNVVDHAQSEKMVKALKKAGKDVEYVSLVGAGHAGWGVRNNVIFLEAVEAFLAKNLTGQIAP